MIITCPECATRYDLEDDRFQPNGRSVRCTACGESWFVPAPEPIDALSRHEPPRREAYRETKHDARPEPRRAPRMDARPPFAREFDRPDEHDDSDARDRYDDHDRSLRAERPGVGQAHRFFDDGRDADGQPEEAEISIVKSTDKDLLPPRDEKGRFMPRDASGNENRQFDDDEDDTLFDTPAAAASSAPRARDHAARDADHDAPPKGWRKGKQFYVEEGDDAPEEDPRPFFAKHFSKGKREDAAAQPARRDREDGDGHHRNGLRFGDDDRERQRPQEPFAAYEETSRNARHESPRAALHDGPTQPTRDAQSVHEDAADSPRHRDGAERYGRDRVDSYDRDREYDRDYREARTREERDYDDDYIPGEATILDADWEDVEDGATGPRFGRRIREGRRRATALARLEDVRRFEPEMLDEEFFRSLHVTPHELERAVRKARRRAEARDKNRLTPWRAFGWSAWVAAVAGAAYAVVAYRDEIVRAAPTAAEAYAVVGIETDPVGLKIENVNHRLAMSTGGPMIEISGSLRNLGGEALDAPLLQAEALGPRGELLARWTFKAEEPTVGGGDISPFTTRNAAPDGVVEVALSFAPTQSVVAPK